jgi:hypothetical protein
VRRMFFVDFSNQLNNGWLNPTIEGLNKYFEHKNARFQRKAWPHTSGPCLLLFRLITVFDNYPPLFNHLVILYFTLQNSSILLKCGYSKVFYLMWRPIWKRADCSRKGIFPVL